MNKKKLVVANWKMNPRSLKEAKQLFSAITKTAARLKRVETGVAMPYTYLYPLRQSYKGKKVKFGAQDMFFESSGPFTGEVSPDMLKDAGVEYVIIGHSERRDLGERNEMVAQKLAAAIESEFKTILCVGERTRDQEGLYLSFLKEQLESALADAPRRYSGNIIIAYEPLWAIGRSARDAVTPYDLHQSVLYIRKIINGIFGDKNNSEIPIIYGGSVEPSNVESLLSEGEADGFLVGHASLVAEEFSEILTLADRTTYAIQRTKTS